MVGIQSDELGAANPLMHQQRCKRETMNGDESSVPDYLEDIYILLKCAFPEGISETEYRPILLLLEQAMSFRTLAQVVSALTDKSYADVYNDVPGVILDPPPPTEDIEKVTRKLDACGYEEWFEKNTAWMRSDSNDGEA